MANPSIHEGDFHVRGRFSASSWGVPAGSIDNAAVAADADLAGSKMFHRYRMKFAVETPADIDIPIHLVNGATATIVGIRAVVETAATGDYEVEIDLKKGSAASAYATVLTEPLVVDADLAARTPATGTLDDSDLVADESLLLSIAATGASGTQAANLLVEVEIEEAPI